MTSPPSYLKVRVPQPPGPRMDEVPVKLVEGDYAAWPDPGMMTRSNTTKAWILSPLWRSRPWRLSSPLPPEPFPSLGLHQPMQL